MLELQPIPPSISPLSIVQQAFSLLNISAEIRIIDNHEVSDVLAGKKMTSVYTKGLKVNW